ncbi:GlcG/HbpS family heme-binding protein [Halarchaeum nitratireducens]|uniref:GlcG/HbpS family heme-binding protein n=1 Tax=Halarchaeum nitratireducens TaxID=489913 RepID=UPI00166754D8|nr:heme-binding protein [Halarchaeum nitratireducens]
MSESITLSTAKELIDAAEEAAEEIGVSMVITVANPAGNLVAQHRMDDAWLASVSISRNKAYTAAALQMPTHELADPTQPGESLWGLQTTDENRLVVFGGGYPLEVDGEIVGTIGVSGGEVAQDMTVAEAGVERFDELTA